MTDLSHFSEVSNPLYSSFIHLSRYARWLPEKGRRETWEETVKRYIDFFSNRFPDHESEIRELTDSVLGLKALPSMRCLMTAGKALERDEVAGYNCSYIAVDSPRAFDEILYVLMCVTDDTWVSTSFGPRQVKDLVDRPFVALVDGKPYFSRTGFFCTGVRPTRVIEAEGFSVRLTDNHPLLVSTPEGGVWRRADEISVGDRIKLADPGLSDWDGSGTEDEGYLLGYFVGDGNFGHLGKMELASYEPDEEAAGMRNKLEEIILSLPGRSDRAGWSFDGNKNGWRIIDKQGANLASKFGMYPGHKKVTPEVEKASSSFYKGFIRGVMDADGHVLASTNDRGIRLKWVDVESLKAIQRMLARFNIKSRITKGPEEHTTEIRDREVRCKQQWILHISGEDRVKYASIVGFENVKKKSRVNSSINKGTKSQRSVMVTSVSEAAPAFVYDVQVDELHAFDANGIVAHNCGTGVGFSVERQYVSKLPEVAEEFHETDTTIVVRDSKIGWAAAFRELVSLLYMGQIPKWDVSKIRPAGARLKTFGGRASGPDPLEDLFRFSINMFRKAAGRKLSSVECHDLVCKVAEIVVVGGVRRCLPGTAKVLTTKGPKRIQDIKVNDFVVVGGKEGRVVDTAYSGVKKTIIINHRFGKLECTPEHKVAVFNSIMKYEFKRADEVVEGDRLVWDSVGFDGGYKNLPECGIQSLHFNASEFRIPNLNEDVAWLIGLIHGDGYISERSIEIAGNMKELHFLEKAADIFHKEFGLQASYGSDGRPGVGARLRVNSAALASWFFKYIKKANTPIRVPEFIMQSSKRVRFAYLAGLFDADGRTRKDGALDATCTVYKDFAEDLVTLCSTLGVAAFVSNGSAQRRRDAGENAQDFYNVRVIGNTNRETFIRGMDSLSMKLENHTVSFTGPVDFSFPIRWAGTTQGYKANGNINVSAMRYDLPLLPSRVVSIEDGSEVPTWDIQVDELECFNTDGLVVHNSALLSLSNVSDDRMRLAKTGQWWIDNAQRQLANNSAAYTEKPEFEVFLNEWNSLYESKSGERGIFSRVAAKKQAALTGRRDPEHEWGTNPCQPASALVLTPEGIRRFSDIDVGSVIWSGKQWTPVTAKWATGIKPVYRYVTRAGVFLGTENHRVVQNGVKGEVGSAENIDVCAGPPSVREDLDPQDVLDGLVLGDGSVHKASNNLVYLNVGEHDQSYFTSEVSDLFIKERPGISPYAWTVSTTLTPKDLPNTYDRTVPDNMFYSSPKRVKGFLRGLYSANGSVIKTGKSGRVTLKTASLSVVERVQSLLSSLGIRSYYTTNRSSSADFGNGSYLCKESYDLNISTDRYLFRKLIGFIQPYKNEKLDSICPEVPSKYANGRTKTSYDVVSVDYVGDEEVYDITVQADEHTYWTQGLLVSNCSEILLRSAQFCNLSEVIVRADDDLDSLLEKVQVATILGTLQSSLTDFRYLRKLWKRNTEDERLLGVSLTGIMDHEVLSGREGDEKLLKFLKAMKDVSIDTNKQWANKLGISQSTSITCVKPSGCRPWDALVTTDQGILTLEDILEDNHNSLSEWSSIEGLVATGAGSVTKSYINGEAPVLGINLSFGMSVESTPNHKWYVKDRGWVRADEIKKGDVLDITPGVYDKLSEAFLLKLNPDALNGRKDASTIIQPEKMSPDLAWLLGYLWGDGSMSPAKYRLRWIDARTENLEKAQSILKSVFDLDSTLHDASEGRQAKVLEVGSKLLWHWLIKNGVWKYYEESIDIIPKVVRCSSKESIIAFLAGLIDADGWSSDSLLTYTTSSEDFSKHVQHVAWAVGIALGRSHNVGGDNFQKRKSMYLMSLLTNSENASLDFLAKHCSKMSAGKRAYNAPYKKAGVVQEVVSLGIKPTYDVETAEHWFFAGAVRSHNTVSQLADTASGIHPRFSKYYIRRVRADKKDPMAIFMRDKGFPCEDDVMNPNVYVFSFPVKAPETARVVKDVGAMEQLRLWSLYQEHWCEHKPSITVYYTNDEFLEVGSWVWNNFDKISGISFLPVSDHVYQQAPYEEIDEEKYNELIEEMPEVSWDSLVEYEKEDNTVGSQTYACTGGICEVVDLTE